MNSLALLFSLSGIYQVPVSNKALEPYAVFPMNNIELEISDSPEGRSKITYNIPKELVGIGGKPTVLETNSAFTNSNWQLFELQLKTIGNCNLVDPETLQCKIFYERLDRDSSSLKSVLESVSVDEQMFADRAEVAKLFGNDSVGVLTIFLNPLPNSVE